MASMQPVRGTHDLLPEKSRVFRHIDKMAHELATVYGFGEISTPIFEFTQVFEKTLGDDTDIVNKEMYTFEDRGHESITLRPEGTAGIARSFISEGLAQQIPLKLFYNGPMFRYERPQKGRQRQFHQIGFETLGVSHSQADVEILCLAHQLLSALHLDSVTELELNSIGDKTSRDQYRTQLVSYLEKYSAELSKDSQKRLQVNPLRILDSKDETDRKILKDAPSFKDHLTLEAQKIFGQVQEGLTLHGIGFKLNPRLVRGLDYYCHTVFEFTTDQLGAQGAVLSGGRYDGLIKLMGGKDTPAVGWAAGVERLALLFEKISEKKQPLCAPFKVAVIPVDDNAAESAAQLTQQLRKALIPCDTAYSGNMAKRMKRANKIGAHWALILGEDEIAQEKITLKELKSGDQKTLKRTEIIEFLKTSCSNLPDSQY